VCGLAAASLAAVVAGGSAARQRLERWKLVAHGAVDHDRVGPRAVVVAVVVNAADVVPAVETHGAL